MGAKNLIYGATAHRTIALAFMPELPKKHVIILGAGASKSSGYPDANRLRQLMSSEQVLREELIERGKFNAEFVDKIINRLMGGNMKRAVNLFRHGGFATVDEFSYLARSRFRAEIDVLKCFLRFALALHDPEQNFHESDYYLFIQRLFQNGLFPLRTDVSIFTFNYDPYLPYLLNKAYSVRCSAVGSRETETDAITSGMTFRNVGALEVGEGLCVLQLHGSIAWPVRDRTGDSTSYTDLFGTQLKERADKLCLAMSDFDHPPIVFPWEIINQNAELISQKEFLLHDAQAGYVAIQGGDTVAQTLYQVFTAIWKRARNEINRATKVSFVGLSMHDFLNPALKFLFADRKEDLELVCANKEHEQRFKGAGRARTEQILMNPLSPTFKLRRLLKQICPSIRGMNPGYPGESAWSQSGPLVRHREDFRDFIENELA